MRPRVCEKNIILYFVKYPQPGKVKTRLAKQVGPSGAAALYQDLARTNFEMIAFLPFDLAVTFDPIEKEKDIRNWLSSNGKTQYLAQQGSGLGERLQNAFHDAFFRQASHP